MIRALEQRPGHGLSTTFADADYSRDRDHRVLSPRRQPLMAATLAGPRRAASAVPGRDRLQCRETVQRLESLFAAVTRFAHASEWQLNAAARAVIVEEHLALAQRLCEPHLPTPVGPPETANPTR